MAVDIEKLLRSDTHREFVAALDSTQAKAMLDLLLVASLADDIVTVEEREDIATAFDEHPDLAGTLDLFSYPLIDYIDALAERWRDDSEGLLEEITEGLGDGAAREQALGTAVYLMRSDSLVEQERALVHRLAERWDLPDGFVRAALIEVND